MITECSEQCGPLSRRIVLGTACHARIEASTVVARVNGEAIISLSDNQ